MVDLLAGKPRTDANLVPGKTRRLIDTVVQNKGTAKKQKEMVDLSLEPRTNALFGAESTPDQVRSIGCRVCPALERRVIAPVTEE